METIRVIRTLRLANKNLPSLAAIKSLLEGTGILSEGVVSVRTLNSHVYNCGVHKLHPVVIETAQGRVLWAFYKDSGVFEAVEVS